jgi:hypothetical protein
MRFLDACRWAAPRHSGAGHAAAQMPSPPPTRAERGRARYSVRRFSRPAEAAWLDACIMQTLRGEAGPVPFPSAGALYGLSAYKLSADSWVFYGEACRHLSPPSQPEIDAAIFEQIDGPYDLLVLCADVSRYMARYGARGLAFAWLEAGAALSDIERSLIRKGCATCWIGGFDDARIGALTGLPPGYHPLICLAVGIE